ncbi:hypothetical protein ACIQK5_10325 [Streptomyces virginiae]|uniref:hypothetical protein n=1 Tax=Streptomyces TaxID=1883 RepID=UPI0013718016|nr:hypothetical protein [Streptomyces sp. SID1046]MYV72923.1 hypothetical protein [Streptomyces sp. SID1046]
MAPVVLVHGIFNHVRGATPAEAASAKAEEFGLKLGQGMARVGSVGPPPGVAVAYYADLLRTLLPEQAQDGGVDHTFGSLPVGLQAEAMEWLAAAGARVPTDAQNQALRPFRQLVGWLTDDRGKGLGQAVREQTVRRVERAVVASLQEVEAYTTWPERRRLVRERIADVIRHERPQVVIAHSLGSYTTYETLHAHPDLKVELLVTVGSPLRVPALVRRLDPALRAGRGAKPPGVERWVNIADVGDVVAVPTGLAAVFDIDHEETCDLGWGVHGLGSYLSQGLVAAAATPYLA